MEFFNTTNKNHTNLPYLEIRKYQIIWIEIIFTNEK